jgi:hypothetical protein
MIAALGDTRFISADTPPLPVKPANAWRPYLLPAFTPGVLMPPGTRHPNSLSDDESAGLDAQSRPILHESAQAIL